MNAHLLTQTKNLLSQGLRDDGWEMDWTSQGSVRDARAKKKARIVAKGPGIWVGETVLEAAEALAREIGLPVRMRSKAKDGAVLKAGQTVAELSGSTRAILTIERPLLNVASYLGGIALQTHELVVEVERAARKLKIPKAAQPRVVSTRKTLPHYRDLSVHAVQAGGGRAHRVSLSGGVLIKENHIAAAGSIARAISGTRSVAPHGLKIEIEVTNLNELKQAVKSGAEVVMLDNFTPAQVTEALALLKTFSARPAIEVSGGITRENVAAYVQRGVDVISVGSLTHSVRAIDLSLLIS